MKSVAESIGLYLGIIALLGLLSWAGSFLPWASKPSGANYQYVETQCLSQYPELASQCRASRQRTELFTGAY